MKINMLLIYAFMLSGSTALISAGLDEAMKDINKLYCYRFNLIAEQKQNETDRGNLQAKITAIEDKKKQQINELIKIKNVMQQDCLGSVYDGLSFAHDNTIEKKHLVYDKQISQITLEINTLRERYEVIAKEFLSINASDIGKQLIQEIKNGKRLKYTEWQKQQAYKTIMAEKVLPYIQKNCTDDTENNEVTKIKNDRLEKIAEDLKESTDTTDIESEKSDNVVADIKEEENITVTKPAGGFWAYVAGFFIKN